MDVAAALSELEELSTQIVEAVVLDGEGSVLGASRADELRARRLGKLGADLLEAAAGAGEPGLDITRVEVSLAEGSVIVLREQDTTIMAVTVPKPTVGLVMFDLRTVLRRIAETEAAS